MKIKATNQWLCFKILGCFIEVFDDPDRVGVVVVLLLGYPQSCTPNPVKGLLQVYEDMVDVLLMLGMFLTRDS